MSINDSSGINFYEPPSSAIEPIRAAPDGDFRLFLTWEKLRLLYNGILIVETVGLMAVSPPVGAHREYLLFTLMFAAFAANVCFCLGPVLNSYARWMGLRHAVVTGLLFGAGMLVAMFFTFGTVLYWGGSLDGLD